MRDPAALPEVSDRIDRLLQVLRGAWPGQLGFAAEYERAMPAENPDRKRQTARPYHMRLRMMAHSCIYKAEQGRGSDRPTGLVQLGDINVHDYTDYEVLLHVNSIGGFVLSEQVMQIDGEHREVVQTHRVADDCNGYHCYGEGGTGGERFLVISRPGESPFVPLTQRQYVHALLAHYDEVWGTPGHPGTFKGGFDADDIAWERQDMQRYLRETPADVLDSPAWTNSLGVWSSVRDGTVKTAVGFSKTRKDFSELLIVNRAYFHDDLPKFAPQMMVMQWGQPTVSEVGRILQQRFNDRFPADALRALLDH